MDFKKIAKVVYRYRNATKKKLNRDFNENKKVIDSAKKLLERLERIDYTKNSHILKWQIETFTADNEAIALMLGKSRDEV